MTEWPSVRFRDAETRGERKEEEEALQADVYNVWRNVGPKWEYRCGNEKIPRRTSQELFLFAFVTACLRD